MTDTGDNVRVAIRVRPLSRKEEQEGHRPCSEVPSNHQIVLGQANSFTFDRVYDSRADQAELYQESVVDMIDSFFQGYNVTILAYGNTGTGKTYTMGTAAVPEDADTQGIIPRLVADIYHRMNSERSAVEGHQIEVSYTTKVNYLEIYNESIRDLLQPDSAMATSIAVREDGSGGVLVIGLKDETVTSSDEMLTVLQSGNLHRTVGSTLMNDHSSRSHAIFSITMERRCRRLDQTNSADEYVMSKFHLVDLAGSERAKKTGATGKRLKESVGINGGLLALGNVISALADTQRKTPALHVPYRESKLTRLLKDSLGGNSRTLMIACVSPSDSYLDESLNTLRYANRARNIRNKPVVNRDPHAALIAQLQGELQACRLLLLKHNIPLDELVLEDVPDPSSAMEALNKLYEEGGEKPQGTPRTVRAPNGRRPSTEKSVDALAVEKEWKVKCEALEEKCEKLEGKSAEAQRQIRHFNQMNCKFQKDYGRLKDELFESECQMLELKRQLGDLQSEKAAVKLDLRRREAKLQKAETPPPEDDRRNVEGEIRLATELERKTTEAQQLEEEIQRLAAEKARAEDLASVLAEQQHNDAAEFQRSMHELQVAIHSKQAMLDEISKKSTDSVRQVKRQYEKRLEGVQQQATRKILEDEKRVKRLQVEIQSLKGKQEMLQQRIREQSSKSDSVRQENNQRITALRKQLQSLATRDRKNSANIAKKETSLVQLKSKLEQEKEKSSMTREAYKELDRRNRQLEEHMEKAKARQDMQRRLELELERKERTLAEREASLVEQEQLQARVHQNQLVLDRGLAGWAGRVHNIQAELGRKHLQLKKLQDTPGPRQGERLDLLRSQIEKLERDRVSCQQKVDQLQSVVGVSAGPEASQLRTVCDHIEDLDAALAYGDLQIQEMQAQMQTMDLEEEPEELESGRDSGSSGLYLTPREGEETPTTQRSDGVAMGTTPPGSPQGMMSIQSLLNHVTAMREEREDLHTTIAELHENVATKEDTIAKLERDRELMKTTHQRDIEGLRHQSREFLRQLLSGSTGY